jgi:hypothetical protein
MATTLPAPAETLQDQLDRERRLVSFDSYDLSVRQIIEMFDSGEIIVPPEYQRQFIWDADRESELIESVLLGIPVPSLFMATNKDSTWEIVDGVQRLSSLAHFIGTPSLLAKVKRNERLVLQGLEKLSSLHELSHEDLPKSVQLMFSTRPMRVTVLNDKSDLNVRFDLFERLNTGGISLTNQEIRNCVYRGTFNDGLKELATAEDFASIIKLKESDTKNGTPEELVLRFFAFLEKYTQFDHSVKGFLNDYMKGRADSAISTAQRSIFKKTFHILRASLPHGISRRTVGVTPVNLYEAIAVGTALALNKRKTLNLRRLPKLLDDPALRNLTTGGTNNRRMVRGRIEHVRDALLAK